MRVYVFHSDFQPVARPLLQDSILMGTFQEGFDVFMGEPDSKRARKEFKKERKTPTSAAPKRGEYRCGKCGFFPKKVKHTCAPDKKKANTAKGVSIVSVPAVAYPGDLAHLNMGAMGHAGMMAGPPLYY